MPPQDETEMLARMDFGAELSDAQVTDASRNDAANRLGFRLMLLMLSRSSKQLEESVEGKAFASLRSSTGWK